MSQWVNESTGQWSQAVKRLVWVLVLLLSGTAWAQSSHEGHEGHQGHEGHEEHAQHSQQSTRPSHHHHGAGHDLSRNPGKRVLNLRRNGYRARVFVNPSPLRTAVPCQITFNVTSPSSRPFEGSANVTLSPIGQMGNALPPDVLAADFAQPGWADAHYTFTLGGSYNLKLSLTESSGNAVEFPDGSIVVEESQWLSFGTHITVFIVLSALFCLFLFALAAWLRRRSAVEKLERLVNDS